MPLLKRKKAAKKKATKKKATKKKATKKKVVRRANTAKRRRSRGFDDDEKDLFDEILNIAVNDGASYRSRSPAKAIDKAFETYLKSQIEYLKDTFTDVRAEAIGDLTSYWRTTRERWDG